jgi:histone H3/H4
MKNLNTALKRKDATKGFMMGKSELSVAPMHRICKKAGASRVSEAAAKALAKHLEDLGIKIAKEAIDYAMHAGRKTVKAEDIEIASRKLLEK